MRQIALLCVFPILSCVLAFAGAPGAAQSASCTALAGELNTRFVTVKSQQPGAGVPEDSGIIVHTIHGPGTQSGVPPGTPGYLDLGQLNALPVDATQSCGTYLGQGDYLPWCGSNLTPGATPPVLSDASSWTYVRADTLIHGAMPGVDDEVVCSDDKDKRYGLIFSNAFMNDGPNLGCMYPLDGDTGNRDSKGCGATTHVWPNRPVGQAACTDPETAQTYLGDYNTILAASGSVAGSLICSLAADQFNTWVAVRKKVDLSQTTWPVNEFVLHNWDSYSTAQLAQGKYVQGIYYLSGCQRTSRPGLKSDAQKIADLYRKWSGVDVPVVALSNAALRNKSNTPFSCQ
ncbi:hypothetical protein [uncultured Tateyamaria sp.]|uniref:hypothetical protein n=1 Tax=uncultured Tateyamaria sp. TaxID=455651 RepID=UPI00261C170C|nr:hypothetical protein [uncultured Tateyamaria sp.]